LPDPDLTLSFIKRHQPLALATSEIHRSRTVSELQDSFLRVVPRFVSADAYGFYLIDEHLRAKSIISHRADRHFLTEYEKIRREDPLFSHLVKNRKFTHSLELFEEDEWRQQPLHDFLTRWGLNYSIEAPLVYDGRISGSLNFAVGRRFFAEESLSAARFLCTEFDAAYRRIRDLQSLQAQLHLWQVPVTSTSALSPRAGRVLELLLAGLGNAAIAARLSISENTVRYHVKRIYTALGVHNRAQLVARIYSAAGSTGRH